MHGRGAGRILVTGGTGFLGFRVVAALQEAGAEVTVMLRPGQEDRLQGFGARLQIIYGDVWNKGSLKGRARGHGVVIHLVGSPHADPARGFTFQQVNLVSARNVIGMAVSDGVPYLILLSSIWRPWALSGEYIRSKREAEEYLQHSGLEWIIVRAPALFAPSRRRLGLRIISLLGAIFPFSLLLSNWMPLPVDVAARGMAQIALKPEVFKDRILSARHLRQLAKNSRQRRPLTQPARARDADPEGLDEPPFGWLPPY
jgi:uncharacterized protein YbjT (DUF2867 family)